MSKLPSERQLDYLKRLGYQGEPPKSAHQVSAAIDALLRQGRAAKNNTRLRNQINDVGKLLGGSNEPLWLNSKTGVRHNSHCRLYQNTVGHVCSPKDGRPCGICGG
jgi:hypothetical protein